MPSWHPPDSDSGMVQDDESTIKVHNNAETRFSWIWPFGSWTMAPVCALECALEGKGSHTCMCAYVRACGLRICFAWMLFVTLLDHR